MPYPFKFNPTWLLEEDFNTLVESRWALLTADVNPMQTFLFKLNKLRPIVITWEKEKFQQANEHLCKIEEDIQYLEDLLEMEHYTKKRKVVIKDLYAHKNNILLHKEETLTHKSREIWLKVGDENTNFFHDFTNK